ncbi:hypothetical protein [Isoptericola sp. NPDC060257]|uniref:hypothetical protein n=1 Tax=Isoptericola sp. NPDC060257 TaxID=3347087 RepID=UPI00365665DD
MHRHVVPRTGKAALANAARARFVLTIDLAVEIEQRCQIDAPDATASPFVLAI